MMMYQCFRTVIGLGNGLLFVCSLNHLLQTIHQISVDTFL